MCQLFTRFSAHALYRLLLLLAQQFSAEKKEGLDLVQCSNDIASSSTPMREGGRPSLLIIPLLYFDDVISCFFN